VHSLSIFHARTNHEQIQTHKTHHGELEGSHHLPPYNILCDSPRDPHPNGILSWNSQMEVLKLPKLGLSQLWGTITLRTNLWLKSRLKQSCSPCQELSNGMLHVIYTQRNRVDSWLLVVRSQTANLTHGPSFGHNLCFRCPNESCEAHFRHLRSKSFPMI